MVDFLNTGNIAKGIVTSINKGVVNSGLDGNVEPLEIEAIHIKRNGEPFLIIIEPADLSIDDDINISMGSSRTGYGRMDPIASYSGTTRSISISFKMIKSEVLNGQDAVTNNSVTANLLKQMLYPAYIDTGNQNTSVIKTAPYFKIRYGDLIGNNGQPLAGFLSNVRVSIGTGRDMLGDNLAQGAMSILPIEYSVSMTFNVLHDHIVGWYDDKFAGDGRINWPFRLGLFEDDTASGPGGLGGNNVSTATRVVPGTPAAVSSKAGFQGGGPDLPF